jgi:hypothetical protein
VTNAAEDGSSKPNELAVESRISAEVFGGSEKFVGNSEIIPGDWGKAGLGWLVWLLGEFARNRGRFDGRIHQFLWRQSRAVQNRDSGIEGRGAIRNRSDPS